MTLQQKTLLKYRTYFPSEPLRVTSARTGIQITRVFRLFSGKTMKVGELEAFEKAINERILENPCHHALMAAVEDASASLSAKEVQKIIEYVQRKVRTHQFAQTDFINKIESLNIA
jgi:hypothetical protein